MTTEDYYRGRPRDTRYTAVEDWVVHAMVMCDSGCRRGKLYNTLQHELKIPKVKMYSIIHLFISKYGWLRQYQYKQSAHMRLTAVGYSAMVRLGHIKPSAEVVGINERMVTVKYFGAHGSILDPVILYVPIDSETTNLAKAIASCLKGRGYLIRPDQVRV